MVFESSLQFLPEDMDFASRLWRLRNDVMKCDQAIRRHQGTVHFPVSLGTTISVIAINEQHIKRTASQYPSNAL